MPYVKRDDFGRIISVHLLPLDRDMEEVAPGAGELMDFLISVSDPMTVREYFDRVDKDFIRVMEDVVQVLIEKRAFSLTDLPPAAQRKLSERRNMRGRKGDLGAIIGRGDSDDLLNL